MTRSFFRLCGAALWVCFLTGCGSSDLPPLARATGIVTFEGSPVEGANVMFHPTEGGARVSRGVTNADGKFTVSTFGMNDGALLGKHKVTIAKADTSDFEKLDSDSLAESGGYGSSDMYAKMMTGKKKGGEVKFIIPEKYSVKEKSGIEVEVTDGGANEFTFNLE